MTRSSDRDEPAETLGRLYDRHGTALYRYAVMILADPSAAADAVQQVFLSLLARGRAIDAVGAIGAIGDEERYLRRAVRNECFSALRRRRRDGEPPEVPILEAADVPLDPAERLALERALRSLPADQREAIHLKVFEGMTYQEIASLTGDSINTIASRYRYAMEKLRAALGARGERP